MFKLILILSLIALVGCVPRAQEEDEYYGAGYVNVSEASWAIDNKLPYPFTVPDGEISCGLHPGFGREVYFMPEGFTDESYIGTPLNKSAVNALKQSRLNPNVPYSISKGADLNEALQIGLKLCDEKEEMLKKYFIK